MPACTSSQESSSPLLQTSSELRNWCELPRSQLGPATLSSRPACRQTLLVSPGLPCLAPRSLCVGVSRPLSSGAVAGWLDVREQVKRDLKCHSSWGCLGSSRQCPISSGITALFCHPRTRGFPGSVGACADLQVMENREHPPPHTVLLVALLLGGPERG